MFCGQIPLNRSGHWSDLYNWPAGMTPSAKTKQPARRDQQAHLARIRDEVPRGIDGHCLCVRAAQSRVFVYRIRNDRPPHVFPRRARMYKRRRMASSVSSVRARNSLRTTRLRRKTCRPMCGTTCGKLRILRGLNAAALETDVMNYLTNSGCLNQFVLQAPALCLSQGQAPILRMPAMQANPSSCGRRRLHRLPDTLGPAAGAHSGAACVRLLQLSCHADGRSVPPQLRGTDRPDEQVGRAQAAAALSGHHAAGHGKCAVPTRLIC